MVYISYISGNVFGKLNIFLFKNELYTLLITLIIESEVLTWMKKIIPFDQLPEISHEGEFRKKDEEIMLDSALSKLSQKQQEVLKLRFFLDFDYQTIADILKIPVGTVKSRISMGLTKLKVILGGEDFAGN